MTCEFKIAPRFKFAEGRAVEAMAGSDSAAREPVQVGRAATSRDSISTPGEQLGGTQRHP